MSDHLGCLPTQLARLATIEERDIGPTGPISLSELKSIESSLTKTLSLSLSLHNAKSSPLINRLPPELLSHIFAFLLPPDLPLDDWLYVPRVTWELRWFLNTVNGVCKHWRHLALNTPVLWDSIYIDLHCMESHYQGRLDHWKEILVCKRYLERSCDVPVRVFYPGRLPYYPHHRPSDPESDLSPQPPLESESSATLTTEKIYGEPNALRYLLDNCAWRLRELHISSQWESRKAAFWDLVKSCSVPLLETLRIELEEPSHFFWDIEEIDMMGILPCVFRDELPRLKSLILRGVGTWPENRFRNLTKIGMGQTGSINPLAQLSVKEFLEFLADSSSTLEELSLSGAGPLKDWDNSNDHHWTSSTTTRRQPMPIVELPMLRWIYVTYSLSMTHLRTLLAHLVVPPQADRYFGEPERADILPIVGYFPSPGHPLVVKELVVTSHKTHYGRHIRHVAYNFQSSLLRYNHDEEEPKELGDNPWTLGLLKDVEKLVYAPERFWDRQFDEMLLASLPSLRCMSISGSTWPRLRTFIKLLLRLEGGRGEGKKMFKYAPNLEMLYVYPTLVKKRNRPQIDTLDHTLGLIKLGRIRAEHGSPIRMLVVDGFEEENVEQLRNRFETVIVDGEEVQAGLSKFWPMYDD